jgi:hypothetical protein
VSARRALSAILAVLLGLTVMLLLAAVAGAG